MNTTLYITKTPLFFIINIVKIFIKIILKLRHNIVSYTIHNNTYTIQA